MWIKWVGGLYKAYASPLFQNAITAEAYFERKRKKKTTQLFFLISVSVAVHASWGICSITQKKKSVFGGSIPNRFSLEATWPRW